MNYFWFVLIGFIGSAFWLSICKVASKPLSLGDRNEDYCLECRRKPFGRLLAISNAILKPPTNRKD